MISSYDILQVYEQIPSIGLANNTVYDIIQIIPSTFGNTTVNSSIYDVHCVAAPQARQFRTIQDGEATAPAFLMQFALDEDVMTVAELRLPCMYRCLLLLFATYDASAQTIKGYLAAL